MSLLEKLKAGVQNVKQTTWPGTENKIGIRVLTEAEIQKAAFETERLFKKAGLEFTTGISDAYQAEQNTQILALALVELDPSTESTPPVPSATSAMRECRVSITSKGPLFKSADELRPLLLPEVKSALIDEQNAFQDENSPSLAKLSDAEYGSLFEGIKKNPSITNSLNSVTRSGLIKYLASLPPSSPPDSGPTSS